MSTTKKRFVFDADAELADGLERVAHSLGSPIAEVIRRAVRHRVFGEPGDCDPQHPHASELPRQPVLFMPRQETR
jgi:hypothetical protein